MFGLFALSHERPSNHDSSEQFTVIKIDLSPGWKFITSFVIWFLYICSVFPILVAYEVALGLRMVALRIWRPVESLLLRSAAGRAWRRRTRSAVYNWSCLFSVGHATILWASDEANGVMFVAVSKKWYDGITNSVRRSRVSMMSWV